MRLRSLELRSLAFRLDAPVHTARGTYAERSGTRVWLTLEDGRVAVGEATPLPEMGTETLGESETALREAVARLSGAELPGTLEALERWVAELVPARAPAARYGLELALLDALAQTRQLSLAELLGGTQLSVSLHALLSAKDEEALLVEVLAAVSQGYRTVKLKLLGGGAKVEAARAVVVRQAVGPEVALRVDANGVWDFDGAVAHLGALAPSRLELCEQPLAAERWARLAELRARVGCALAADESLALPEAVAGLVECPGRVDVLVLKPTVLGGVLPALRLAQRAADVGVRSYVTHTLEGAVARAGAAQLAAVVHGMTGSGSLAAGVQLGGAVDPDFDAGDYRTVEGKLFLPRAPGLGLQARASTRGAA